MVVPHASLITSRAAGRFDPADKSCGAKGVQGLIYGLQGDVPNAGAHPGGDHLDP
jgi:hypothetical protein